jgi:hypothetical protein
MLSTEPALEQSYFHKRLKQLTPLNLHFACPNTAQKNKGRELNSRPLDVDVL